MKVIAYPDEFLKIRSTDVVTVDEDIQRVIETMFALMYENKGVGLSAIQIGVPQRIFVMNLTPLNREGELVFINPKLDFEGSATRVNDEGCLSIPGVYAAVIRHRYVRVTALDCNGDPLDMRLHGRAALIAQHEHDHLEGKLFIDFLSPEARAAVLKDY